MLARLIRYVLTLAVIVSLFSSVGFAANGDTVVYVDGIKQSKSTNLVIQNKSTYMPMLDFGTKLGYVFTKDTISGKIFYYLTKGTRKVQLSVEQNRIWVNGKLQSLQAPILVKSGATYLALDKVGVTFGFSYVMDKGALRISTKSIVTPSPSPTPKPSVSPSPTSSNQKLAITYITSGLEIDAKGFTAVSHRYVWKQKANLNDSISLSIQGISRTSGSLAGGKVYVNQVSYKQTSVKPNVVTTTIELKKATTYRVLADKKTGKIQVLFLGVTPSPSPSPSPSPTPSPSPSPSPTSSTAPGTLGTIVYLDSGVEISTAGLTGVTHTYVKPSAANPLNQIVLDLKGIRTAPLTMAGGRIFVDQVRAQQLTTNPAVTRLTIVLKKDTPYYVNTDNNTGKVTVNFGTAPTVSPMPGVFKVVIDPGHGGKDPGAIGIGSKFESILNLNVGNKVVALLKKVPNVQVFTTRNTDTFIELTARSAYANTLGANLFIAIHTNASINPNAHGVETHYYQNDDNDRGTNSKRFANLVQAQLVAATSFKDNGIVPNNGLNVIRNTKMPAVLLEMGYITNVGNNTALWNDATQDRIAQAVVNAILTYKNGK
jgi:N-acetylmuramoyl-L-alanine amidase